MHMHKKETVKDPLLSLSEALCVCDEVPSLPSETSLTGAEGLSRALEG